MATQPLPRPQYPSQERPAKAKPAGQRRAKGLPRVGKKRAKEKRQHDQCGKTFLEYNPKCACGCGKSSKHPHHIAQGAAGRDASLHDTDLQLGTHDDCHRDKFHDASKYPKPRQLAIKCRTIFEKYNAAAAIPVSREAFVAAVVQEMEADA